ncbi:MAG: hypothetical protein ACI9F9_001777 [Candidatus Paceibacteria bacterium]|jgi:hypothetical protein
MNGPWDGKPAFRRDSELPGVGSHQPALLASSALMSVIGGRVDKSNLSIGETRQKGPISAVIPISEPLTNVSDGVAIE